MTKHRGNSNQNQYILCLIDRFETETKKDGWDIQKHRFTNVALYRKIYYR